MTIEDRTTNHDAAIRELIDGLVTAIRAKNIDGMGVTLRHADCCLLSGPTLRVPSC